MRFQILLCLSLLTATSQLSLHSGEADDRAVDPDVDPDREGPEPDQHPMFAFGGIFEMHDAIQQHFERQAEESQLLGKHTGHSPQRALQSSESTPEPTYWHPGQSGGPDIKSFDERRWPATAWKAPLSPDDSYPGKPNWPLDTTRQCSEADVQELNFYALKQAKKRLPREGYNGTNFNGECFRYNFNGWALNVTNYAKCFQKFYTVSTSCASCIGKVYNMAFFNWSQPCYNFCKGRPNRRDGAHWCWEDCQSCMWYIGKQLTTCYGEPYDMQCRYARELGKEEWFENNGINPKR